MNNTFHYLSKEIKKIISKPRKKKSFFDFSKGSLEPSFSRQLDCLYHVRFQGDVEREKPNTTVMPVKGQSLSKEIKKIISKPRKKKVFSIFGIFYKLNNKLSSDNN